MISAFESMKPEERPYFLPVPIEVIRGIAMHYGNGESPKNSEDIDYINDNLENIVNQVEMLKDNPLAFHKNNRAELLDFVNVVKPIVDEIQDEHYSRLSEEMDGDY